MSRRDAVLDQLRSLVVEGALRPGDRLVERTLAERLGVSRVPVREALRDLVHEGLAEVRPTRGMVVRALDADDLAALFEVREAIEGIVCRRVVAVADEAGLDRLDALVEEAADAARDGDQRTAVARNAAFHAVLVELADSPVLTAVMEPVAGRMRWLLSQHVAPDAMSADHADIASALRDRDAEGAVALCRRHLEASRHAVAALTDGPHD